jgi:hypothetical protein
MITCTHPLNGGVEKAKVGLFSFSLVRAKDFFFFNESL